MRCYGCNLCRAGPSSQRLHKLPLRGALVAGRGRSERLGCGHRSPGRPGCCPITLRLEKKIWAASAGPSAFDSNSRAMDGPLGREVRYSTCRGKGARERTDSVSSEVRSVRPELLARDHEPAAFLLEWL